MPTITPAPEARASAERSSIEDVVKGDTVNEVLRYVQYDPEKLLGNMRQSVERAVRTGKLTVAESGQLIKFYENGLEGYTYLE